MLAEWILRFLPVPQGHMLTHYINTLSTENDICLLYFLLEHQVQGTSSLVGKWQGVKVNLHFQLDLELLGRHSLGHICEGISTLAKGGAIPWAAGLG